MTLQSYLGTACEVAVVGAGPHGLCTAAHLRAGGVDVRVFGEVMGFWRNNMPQGMLLRSERPGSHMPDPDRTLTLERFEAAIGKQLPRRIPLDDFVAYGVWYQRNAVPGVDGRQVVRIDAAGDGFSLTLDDGEAIEAKRVVVATGLAGFEARPPAFARVSSELAPHSCQVRVPRAFAGLRVAVIGAGQSALETAALLHEAGADVELIVRRSTVRFLSGRDRLRNSPIAKLVYPPGEVGPPGLNWVIELPDLFRSLPKCLQKWVTGQLTPIGSAWLRPRLAGVRSTVGRTVSAVAETRGRLQLVLDDSSRREVDRVVLATGYRVQLDRHPILTRPLIASLRQLDGSPQLQDGLESSVPGLHFVGAAAVASFGPLMRFVAGAGYAARAVTRHVASSSRVPWRQERPWRYQME